MLLLTVFGYASLQQYRTVYHGLGMKRGGALPDVIQGAEQMRLSASPTFLFT